MKETKEKIKLDYQVQFVEEKDKWLEFKDYCKKNNTTPSKLFRELIRSKLNIDKCI